MFYFDGDDDETTDADVLKNACLFPRAVSQYIKEKRGFDCFWILFLGFSLIITIYLSFFLFNTKGSSHEEQLKRLIFICSGLLFGWLPFYIWAALTYWLEKGSKNKDKGDFRTLIRVWACSLLPFIITFICVGGIMIEIFFFKLFGSMAAIWSLTMLVIGVSEVQNISIGRAMVNITISFVILAVTVLFPFYLLVIK